MPKQLPADLLDRVTGYLADRPKGLTLAELETFLEGVASRRSLQRRLDEWVRSGAIRAKGVRRGRRYFSATTPTPNVAYGIAEAARPVLPQQNFEAQATIPVSTAGEDI